MRLLRSSVGFFLDTEFPFLFGGTFIEAYLGENPTAGSSTFPFLFGGTFIEAWDTAGWCQANPSISLPFRRDFH